MKLAAFNADAAIREQLINRLKTHAECKRIVTGPLAWDGTTGSLVGCLLESEYLSKWECELGLPQWLALIIDSLCASQPTLIQAIDLGFATLKTIPCQSACNTFQFRGGNSVQ